MPTSHHRKKHKNHQQQHAHHVPAKRKGSAGSVMAIVGGIVGFAITYLASNANWIWIAIATVIGACIGFSIGKTLDKAAGKGG